MSRTKAPFYAVRRGRETGIFRSWGETQRSTSGFSGAEHRKFARREDAEAWLASGPDKLKRESTTEETAPAEEEQPVKKKQCLPPVTVIHCDGACLANGTENARAGIGVWFGVEDART